MREKIIKVGYSTYLTKEKKLCSKSTSKIGVWIKKHKFISVCIAIIIIALIIQILEIIMFFRVM